MTVLDSPVVEDSGHPSGKAALEEPAGRGVTVIAPLVFEKLARQAAAEVPGVEGEVRTGLDRLWPWASGSSAEASAAIDDDQVVVDLTFNVAYPEPVRQVAEAVRRHVADRIRWLTGRAVRSINITVPELVEPSRHRRRVT